MSDGIFDQTNELPTPDEKTILLERAKHLGIKVSGNIGLETLRQRVSDHLEGKITKDEDDETVEEGVTEETAPIKETLAGKVKRLRMEAHKLVRVRITCMNPFKKDITGEVVTVSNKYIGKVSKLIPFNLEEPYHVPQVLLDELRARRYLNVKTTRKGKVDVVQPESMRELPEYAIEVLPPLTKQELTDLRVMQSQSGSTAGD